VLGIVHYLKSQSKYLFTKPDEDVAN